MMSSCLGGIPLVRSSPTCIVLQRLQHRTVRIGIWELTEKGPWQASCAYTIRYRLEDLPPGHFILLRKAGHSRTKSWRIAKEAEIADEQSVYLFSIHAQTNELKMCCLT